MSDVLWLNVLGLRTKLTLSDVELAVEARRAWAACLAAAPDDESASDLEVSDAPGQQPQSDLPRRIEQLTQSLTVSAIEHLAGVRLMLHACAVADDTSRRCVVFVGPSGMGKTTVAKTLGQQWNYVTDECVSINSAGLVYPFPKPLSVVVNGVESKDQVSPFELGLTPSQLESRPVALVLLRRDARAAVPEVSRVSTVQAVAHLAEHSSYLASLPRPLTLLARLVHAAGGLQVVHYAEAIDLAPFTKQALDGVGP